MPPRKEVYHEKQEVDSTVWITYSFVGDSQLYKYKQRMDHLPRRDAKDFLVSNLARGGHSPYFVHYPWSDD